MLRVLAAVLLALVLAGCADEPVTAPVTAPGPSPDAAFLSGMIPHHEQALELSAMVGGRGGSPGLEAMALRIDREQVEEIGQMQGLMRARGLAPVAAGMMHGMADPATLATLRSSQGPAFERLWLDTMINHHDGALVMARDYLATGTDETLRRYAQVVVATQSGEIEAMRAMRTSIAGP
jgi:uncharacterized protein (DUF305 family)